MVVRIFAEIRICAVIYGVICQDIDGGDDRRGDARTAEDVPIKRFSISVNSASVAVVDCHAGVRVCDRRDVGHGAICATLICLPFRLGDVGAAAATGAAPHTLGPSTCGAAGQARAAHGGDISGCSRELDTIAAVAGAHGDGDARMLVVVLVALLEEKLLCAIAVD